MGFEARRRNRAGWVMAQSWLDLLFMHWPLPYDRLRAVVPPELPLDTYEGEAWIGVVPFYLDGLRLRGLPPLPGIRRFPELNVRTYATVDGKPGVYFFSLDAGNPLAVATARLMSINYFYAWMRLSRVGDTFAYVSRRIAGRAQFRASYRPIGRPSEAAPGTLVHFLTERYCLYTVDPWRRVGRLDIAHQPWQLRTAEAEVELNTMVRPLGLNLPDTAPLLLFSARQDMVAWPPTNLRRPPRR